MVKSYYVSGNVIGELSAFNALLATAKCQLVVGWVERYATLQACKDFVQHRIINIIASKARFDQNLRACKTHQHWCRDSPRKRKSVQSSNTRETQSWIEGQKRMSNDTIETRRVRTSSLCWQPKSPIANFSEYVGSSGNQTLIERQDNTNISPDTAYFP